MKTVIYEWCYEAIEDGDIMECDFQDKLNSFSPSSVTETLCLVRNEGDEINGLSERYWAYVVDGKLPDLFSDAMGVELQISIPEKFKRELLAYQKTFINP